MVFKKFFLHIKDAYIRNRAIILDLFWTSLAILFFALALLIIGGSGLELLHISDTLDLIYEAFVEGV